MRSLHSLGGIFPVVDIFRNKTLIVLAAIGAVLVIAGAATWDQWAGWLAGIGALL